ncbi:MAG TPA: dihydrofolate reductase family protein, partial [Candidatus Polarisedimenticolaceae bacterium]|nr:dihydrofolate reductase family protein [Candidatus Polarisedimenticolaceae bacterium]
MRKIVVFTMVSLDGVMQAPGGPEEDTSGGFQYGGWTVAYSDESFGKIINEELSVPFDLLLGRKTYEIFAAYWPKHTGAIADPFNKAKKYVASDKGVDPTWKESILIHDDVVAQLKALKAEDGPMLQVHGSAKLLQTLLKNDLVDELRLRIFPITLGIGKRLFAEGTIPAAFELRDSRALPSGVILANYKRSGEVKTGSFD